MYLTLGLFYQISEKNNFDYVYSSNTSIILRNVMISFNFIDEKYKNKASRWCLHQNIKWLILLHDKEDNGMNWRFISMRVIILPKHVTQIWHRVVKWKEPLLIDIIIMYWKIDIWYGRPSLKYKNVLSSTSRMQIQMLLVFYLIHSV